MSQQDKKQTEEKQGVSKDRPVRTITSKELFGEDKELYLVHEGEVYRLRITRRNRLILQK